MSADLILHVDHCDSDDEDLVMCCMGGAVYGRRGCTCWAVAETVVEPDAREGLPCHDCAGLPGSPEDESGAWLRISRQKVPFYCHAGMSKATLLRHEVTGETKPMEPDAYQPPRVDGVPMRADGTPARVCVCWARLQGDCWGFPWSWWSAMDFCCEQEIATDRAEVERRIDATIASLGETLACVDDWRDEGAEGLPDPLPILQGRTVADYVRCADGLTRELRAAGRDGLPELVGVGSVCRRQLHGPEGLLPILSGLDRELPSHVRLHLFGVKGDVLAHLGGLRRRVASVDSMAWDFAARMDARKAGVSCTVERRAAAMRDWYRKQLDKVLGVDDASLAQLPLFGATL